MDTLLTTFIVSTITGIVTFFYGIKKQKNDNKKGELENISLSIEIYQTIITDLKNEIESMSKKIDKLENSVEELMLENSELKKMLKSNTKKLTTTSK
jgi:peptidoglycan hydrolase CwlO-like protein